MRGLRTVVTAAAVAVLATGGIAGAAVAAESGAGAGACQPGTLKVTTTDAGRSQVGMNHAGTYLKVTNTGDETCAIKGYAGLALEGAGHTALKTKVRHGDTYFAQDPGAHTVTLKPGGVAYADLVWTHTGADAAPAKYLQVSPTGSNSHSVVPLQDDVDNGTLNLTAWSAKLPTAG
ncbi:DUF4232 domain-containing protein [Streptomyces niger]|uniref:DUF4232 domain-containing protein n=1 Tax=Streptomyces niger TaxID=66373 RepID=UPI000A9EB1A4|nr:DUF4232 domain-containing protein [Streptomyces niger]